jgi:branched-chain amino acid transport system permease protein
MEFSLPLFFEILIRGSLFTTMYIFMTIGLLLIYGQMRMVNFAHGEFYLLGGYIFYCLSPILGLLSIPISVIIVFGIAFLIERGLLHSAFVGKIEKPGEYALLITYAISLFIKNFVIEVFGPFAKFIPSLLPYSINIPYINIDVEGSRIVYSLVAIFVLIALYLFRIKTRMGRAFDAVAQNRMAARIRGIDDSKVASISFSLGCALSALAGIFISPTISLYPAVGWTPVLKGFVVLIIAGLGSIMGCIVASLIVAFSEVLGNVFISPMYRDLYGFIVMMVILTIKPWGLFGEVERRRV